MKKVICVILSMVLAIAPVSSIASGSDVVIDFSYDKETRALAIDGTFGADEHIACMVYIYDASLTSSQLSDSNTPIFAELVTTGSNGSFEFRRTLSDTYSSGKYRVSVSSSQANWTTEFMYTNESSVDLLLGQINGAATASALENVLTTNAGELGIDLAVYLPVKSDVAGFLFSTKPAYGYGDAAEFINALEQCTASALLKSGSDAARILQANAKAISIDYEDDYNKFTSDIKSAINTELKNADYTSGLLSNLYPELRTVAFMKAAPTWQALKNAFYGVDTDGNTIVSNYSVINPDLTVYNTVANKDNVFALMFKQRSSLISVQNIRTVFKNCAVQAYNDEQRGSSDNQQSSSPSTSSPVSGPVSIDPGYTNQYTGPAKQSLFYDIGTADWYYESVEKLSALSLINGYEDKSFRPDNLITRAEYTKLIVGMANHLSISLEQANNDTQFTDVLSSDWYVDVVRIADLSGLVMGNGGRFSPNDHITRQDAAVILYRLATKIKAIEGNKTFADDNMIADYAKAAVSSLASANIISGMGDNTFAPGENLTRAQAAKLLYGALEYLS